MQLILRKLHFVLLICFVVTFPSSLSYVRLNNIIVALLTATSIATFFLSRKEKKLSLDIVFILCVCVYLVHFVGLLRSNNSHQAFADIEKKVALFLFPVLLFISPRLSIKEFNFILLSFVLCCVLTMMFCLSIATYRFGATHESSIFFYHDFSGIVGIHAIYLSLYCCFSIAILLSVYGQALRNFNRWINILYYSSLIILAVSILLLSGRTQIFILVIGISSYLTYRFSKTGNLVIALGKGLSIFILTTVIVLLFPVNRERFKEAINYKGQYNLGGRWGEQQMRPLIWGCALNSIKSTPMLGVGTGDVQDELQKCYIERDHISLLLWEPMRFNAHNQFLETTVGLGILGFFIFVASLFYSFRHAFTHKKALYVIFLSLFVISCLTESLLERRQGILFFAFFNAFLFLGNPFKKSTND